MRPFPATLEYALPTELAVLCCHCCTAHTCIAVSLQQFQYAVAQAAAETTFSQGHLVSNVVVVYPSSKHKLSSACKNSGASANSANDSSLSQTLQREDVLSAQ